MQVRVAVAGVALMLTAACGDGGSSPPKAFDQSTSSDEVSPCSELPIRVALDAQAVPRQLPPEFEVAEVRCHTQDGVTYAGARVQHEDELTWHFAVFESAGDGWRLIAITPDVLGSGLPRFLLSNLFPDDAGYGA